MKLVRDYTKLLVLVSAIIGLDQWTKWLVRENIPFMGVWLPDGWEWLMPYARIVHWYNTGAAFGMFQGYGWVFAPLALVVAGLIVYYYPRTEPADWWLRLAMGMQMSGALGNLIDRLMLDWKVTDFISVGEFPVFNVADASLSVGVVILLLGVWVKESREKKQQPEQQDDFGDEPASDNKNQIDEFAS